MLRLLPERPDRPLRVLCLGAHADDIEIGCGGTILTLASGVAPPEIRWVVLSGDDRRAAEARASAAELLAGTPGPRVELHRFRDGFFPGEATALKEVFESLKAGPPPDLVLTHALADAHQDHRTVAELTHQTFRDHLVLEYEIPKHDGDFGNPGIVVPLAEVTARKKAAALLRHYESQRQRHWFAEDTFLALMRLRGAFSGAPEGYAEAFWCRKALIRL